MIPGWITQAIAIELLDKELPIPHVAEWSEPFSGRVLDLNGHTFGSMRIQPGADIAIQLIQDGVFGASLMDSFTVAFWAPCAAGADPGWEVCE